MPSVEIPSSPLMPAEMPVRIGYRDIGKGRPIVLLHGGWGYEVYPFDDQIAVLSGSCRIVIPDRSGYGASPPIDDLPPDFHHRAAVETRSVVDALDLREPILWGHSDGAIIALLLGLASPRRTAGMILEATHFNKHKPSSRAFFEAVAADPASIGDRAVAALMRDHGERWPQIVQMHSRAWLRIAAEARSPREDFYDGRLRELSVPTLLVHGAGDPRTEPGELNDLRTALAATRSTTGDKHVHRAFQVFAAGHSPHSEHASADAVTRAAVDFLRAIGAVDSATGESPRNLLHSVDSVDPAPPADPAHPALRHD